MRRCVFALESFYMNSLGELVSKAIDLMDEGFYDDAFPFVCAALKKTLQKSLETEDITLSDYKNFVNEHWDLISFMCLPNVNSAYLEKRLLIKASADKRNLAQPEPRLYDQGNRYFSHHKHFAKRKTSRKYRIFRGN